MHGTLISDLEKTYFLIQPIIDSLLRSKPACDDLHISKRQCLARQYSRNPLLPIAPPIAVGQPAPPGCISTSPRRSRRHCQEETEAPALRRIAFLRVDFGCLISKEGIRRWRT